MAVVGIFRICSTTVLRGAGCTEVHLRNRQAFRPSSWRAVFACYFVDSSLAFHPGEFFIPLSVTEDNELDVKHRRLTNALEPTPGCVLTSAFAVDSAGPAWLSFLR